MVRSYLISLSDPDGYVIEQNKLITLF